MENKPAEAPGKSNLPETTPKKDNTVTKESIQKVKEDRDRIVKEQQVVKK